MSLIHSQDKNKELVYTMAVFVFTIDPAYWEQSVPNLDGCDGHSDLIIFGSNIDTKIPSENGPSHLVTDNTTKAEVNGSSVTGPQKEGTENDESAKVKESSSDSENAAKL